MKGFLFFFYAFTSFFAIVNPISGLVTFISLTDGMETKERKRTAFRSVATACVLALIFALTGELILRLFNVTLDNLMVAGGVLLMLIAVDMMQARTSRESVTPEEIKDAAKRQDIAVFPIATPLLTGPGAITTAVVLMRTGDTVLYKFLTVLALILTFALSYLIFRFSIAIYRLLGITVTLVITRIMGLLVAAIAVNFISVGIWNIYNAMISMKGPGISP